MNARDFATTLMSSLRGPLERSLRQIRSDLQESIDARFASLPVPQDGKSVTVDDLRPVVDEAVEKAVAAIPVPKDGKSVTVEEAVDAFRPDVERMVAEAVAAIPVPQDGKSVTIDELRPMVDEVVAKAVAAIPPAKDGRDGRDADPNEIELVVRRLFDELPKPRDGRDGIATREEIITVVREAVAAAVPSEVEKAVTEAIKSVPRLEYRGVWSEAEYQKGDAVSFGGSLWICRTDQTAAKPGTSPDWQLAVKKGRDARGVN